MSVFVFKTPTGYRVNGKPVTQAPNGNWIKSLELSESEITFFNQHINHYESSNIHRR